MSNKEETDLEKLQRLMQEAAVAVGKALAYQLEYNLDKEEIKEFLTTSTIQRQEYVAVRITEEWFDHNGLKSDIEVAMSTALEAS